VVKTDVHFPTDINLLHDAICKAIQCSTALSEAWDLDGWRQHAYHRRQFKKQYRAIQQLKHSTAKDESKREARQRAIQQAHRRYLELAEAHLARVDRTLAELAKRSAVRAGAVTELNGYVAHAKRQIDQIRRRVLQGEVIPHAEKVFSIFQPHTEWISKGKAGVPVELGLRVCILEDQHRFILHTHVMARQTDEQVAVAMVEASQARFPTLRTVSFDKGFHSPANRRELEVRLDLVACPKKGRLSVADRQRESTPAFVSARHQHAAVESAINGLQHFGLDRCPDQGIAGFKRYVALAMLARNLHRLGVVVREPSARGKPPVPQPRSCAA